MSYSTEDILTNAMRQACAAARQYIGATTPNPPVGAAAVDSTGKVIAVAAHRQAGTDHAEAALIKTCREQNLLNQIHTLVVTLEPCNHHGRTPPCTQAILDAGIKHVVIGALDPNPEVAGGGAAFLQARGVKVTTGIAIQECRQLIATFAVAKTQRRSFITVKRAFDALHSMIPPPGQKTFAAQDSLLLAHRLRKKADAIVTGSGTILADNPLFTVRHTPDHPGKTRILAIADRRQRVGKSYLDEAAQRGFKVMFFNDPTALPAMLLAEGAQDVLIEAGPALSQAFLDRGLWDLKVDIYCGGRDRVTTALNTAANLPINEKEFQLENILPP